MRGGQLEFLTRVKYAFYATLIFILVTNPITTIFTQSLFQGSLILLHNNILTSVGILFHIVLFFLLFLSVMMFTR